MEQKRDYNENKKETVTGTDAEHGILMRPQLKYREQRRPVAFLPFFEKSATRKSPDLLKKPPKRGSSPYIYISLLQYRYIYNWKNGNFLVTGYFSLYIAIFSCSCSCALWVTVAPFLEIIQRLWALIAVPFK